LASCGAGGIVAQETLEQPDFLSEFLEPHSCTRDRERAHPI
jgi:hypothetical protein